LEMADSFELLKSVEYVPERQTRNLQVIKNKNLDHKIELYTGKSSECLPAMLLGVNGQVVFFLDAHPSGKNSGGHKELMLDRANSEFTNKNIVSGELEIILNHHIKNHVILIDDVCKGLILDTIYPLFEKYGMEDDYNFFYTRDMEEERKDKMLFCEPKGMCYE